MGGRVGGGLPSPPHPLPPLCLSTLSTGPGTQEKWTEGCTRSPVTSRVWRCLFRTMACAPQEFLQPDFSLNRCS